jgi:hypothetical protein
MNISLCTIAHISSIAHSFQSEVFLMLFGIFIILIYFALNVIFTFQFISIFLFQTFAVFWILCVIFWVFPQRLIIECRRFGTVYLFHLQRLDMKCPTTCRSQWPRGRRHGSAAAALWNCGFGSRRGINICVMLSVVCCQVSSIGLCDGLITRTEESYRMWCGQWVWS